jgi:hypothetical protein
MDLCPLNFFENFQKNVSLFVLSKKNIWLFLLKLYIGWIVQQFVSEFSKIKYVIIFIIVIIALIYYICLKMRNINDEIFIVKSLLFDISITKLSFSSPINYFIWYYSLIIIKSVELCFHFQVSPFKHYILLIIKLLFWIEFNFWVMQFL